MRLYRDLSHVDVSTFSVVTIGSFDGLHLGHQALIRRCRELAGEAGEVAVVTFEPAPKAWFNPNSAVPRLIGVAQKLDLLEREGVDLVWMMRFNGRLASMEATEFVAHILVRGLAAQHVVLGEDFRFGKNRHGDLGMLRELGRTHGFEVHAVPTVTHDGVRISSTAVRDALAAGQLDVAAALLGRPYSVTGRVQRGRQLGRDLGFPTANVHPPAGDSPLRGIFAVRARVDDGPWQDGVANLGRRPAVGGQKLLLEVHLFECDDDLYGRRLETQFVGKIRDEEDFPSLDELVAQMTRDEAQAKAALEAIKSEQLN